MKTPLNIKNTAISWLFLSFGLIFKFLFLDFVDTIFKLLVSTSKLCPFVFFFSSGSLLSLFLGPIPASICLLYSHPVSLVFFFCPGNEVPILASKIYFDHATLCELTSTYEWKVLVVILLPPPTQCLLLCKLLNAWRRNHELSFLSVWKGFNQEWALPQGSAQ